MSFFKKMVDKIEDMLDDDDDKKKKEEKHKKEKEEDHSKDPSHQYSSQQAPFAQQQPPYQSQQPAYGAPPPMQSNPNPTGGPPLPPGWIAQWDPNSQRYYFLEQATGRTQWEPPQQQHMGSQGGFPPAAYGHEAQHMVHGGSEKEKKEKKGDKGNMLAAGAGGLAVGALGGAAVGHAMGDDSSDDGHAYQQQPAYVQQPAPGYQDPAAAPLEAPPPDSGSASSSDVEDLAEAREDYANASDASDREEAREEYEEQYEETYGSD
ncbi:MAG: hypothetical protein Q9222_003922 [Ikaeria aurantiellina]